MELADLVVVMSMGRIEQIGTPREVRTPPRHPLRRGFRRGLSAMHDRSHPAASSSWSAARPYAAARRPPCASGGTLRHARRCLDRCWLIPAHTTARVVFDSLAERLDDGFRLIVCEDSAPMHSGST